MLLTRRHSGDDADIPLISISDGGAIGEPRFRQPSPPRRSEAWPLQWPGSPPQDAPRHPDDGRGYNRAVRRILRILNAAAVVCLVSPSGGCHSPVQDPPSVQLPESFVRSLRESTVVEFNDGPHNLARMSDAEFDELLRAYRAVAAPFASTAAIDAATEGLRHRREVAKRAAGNP